LLQDREEVLSKSKLLKSANIYVSEDLSRKTREHRNELFKYMRFIKKRAPNKKCVIRYDKLFVDNDVFIYDENEGKVVRNLAKSVSPDYTRPDSRQSLRPESSLGKMFSPQPALARAESVHSVNGHPELYSTNMNQNFGSVENIAKNENQESNLVADPNAQNLPNIVEEQESMKTEEINEENK